MTTIHPGAGDGSNHGGRRNGVFTDQLSHDEERQLDLLVDGELDQAKRRRLLESLDARPEGWRRCALAFLEAQSWQRDLHGPGPALSEAIARLNEPHQNANVANRPDRKSFASNYWPSWGSMLAVAASFALAFGLGTFWGGTSGGPPIARIAPPGAQPKYAANTPPVVLVSDWGGEPQGIEVPVRDVSQANAAQAEIPPEAQKAADSQWAILKALEDAGHRIFGQRQILPVQLRDGRKVYIPYDEYDVIPATQRDYQ